MPPARYEPTVAQPQPASPAPPQLVTGLSATSEGGGDLVQLLTPEGQRVHHPGFDGYVAEVGPKQLQSLYLSLIHI